jgi:hypothetical protein
VWLCSLWNLPSRSPHLSVALAETIRVSLMATVSASGMSLDVRTASLKVLLHDLSPYPGLPGFSVLTTYI